MALEYNSPVVDQGCRANVGDCNKFVKFAEDDEVMTADTSSMTTRGRDTAHVESTEKPFQQLW